MEIENLRKLIRNALLSLFFFALPIILMFCYFYLTDQRPWENQQKHEIKTNSNQPIE